MLDSSSMKTDRTSKKSKVKRNKIKKGKEMQMNNNQPAANHKMMSKISINTPKTIQLFFNMLKDSNLAYLKESTL